MHTAIVNAMIKVHVYELFMNFRNIFIHWIQKILTTKHIYVRHFESILSI